MKQGHGTFAHLAIMDNDLGRYGNPPQKVLPASHYLHERLQERRARNTRPKRSRQSDFGPRRAHDDDDIFLEEAEQSRYGSARMYDSSPLAAGSRVGSEAGGSAYSKRRSIGVKDMDGQMDRMNKQNFALKLELDHRREQQLKLQEQLEAMREQVERAERLEEEHAELLKINTQLVEELEKRDKAVEEAMDIICDLEDKVVDWRSDEATPGHQRLTLIPDMLVQRRRSKCRLLRHRSSACRRQRHRMQHVKHHQQRPRRLRNCTVWSTTRRRHGCDVNPPS